MAKNLVQRRAPGSVQPFVSLNPAPVIANRAPTADDNYESSTIWIQQVDTSGVPVNTIWILASVQNSVANWIEIAPGSGAGNFTSLTVNPGPVDFTGDFTQEGDADINVEGAGTTNINTGTATGDVTIGNATGEPDITIVTGAAGSLQLNVAGQLGAASIQDTVASPATATDINARLGYSTWTGFTTAAAGTQVLTVNNNTVLANSAVMYSINNEGSNDAQMWISRCQVDPGVLTFTLVNGGAAALNGDINITFWVLD